MTKRTMPRSRWQIVFTCVLLAVSTYLTKYVYPYPGWLFFAWMSFYSLLAIILRVGWVVPCMIAGAYAGLAMGTFPEVNGHSIESEVLEAVTMLMFGTLTGLFFGWLVDNAKRSSQNESDGGKS